MKRKYSAKEIKDIFKITGQTLYNWRKTNQIKFTKLNSTHFVYYLDHDLDAKDDMSIAIYARVSNTKQKNDLERQISILKDFAVKNGWIVNEVYSDIASGMSEKRKDFNRLINDIILGKISKVLITYEDRLVRFGFNFMKQLFEKYDTEIICTNAAKDSSYEEELTKDLIAIIHHFSMKMYSSRRTKLKNLKRNLIS
jgi:predicted site-specific integrase-resolvase